MRRLSARPALLLGAAIALSPLNTPAQTAVKRAQPGFNLFTVQQDVEIGQQSGAEADKQLPLLKDAQINRYLTLIVQRLAAQAPGARYPYTIKVVNQAEINAFSLPGGPMYVNRGLITATRNEAELAGVLAHEMSHVALRHGTHQASNAYIAQAGLGILGGLLGRQTSATQIVNAVGGLGLNTVFLKFSRDAEYQADATGAEIMAKAGYDPVAAANFMALLRQEQGRDPTKLERFFSDHPPAAERETRLRTLARSLGPVQTNEVGGLARVQSRLGSTTVASSAEAAAAAAAAVTAASAGEVASGSGHVQVNVAAPSSRFASFAHPTGFFTIIYPDNWLTYASGSALSMAPRGGVVNLSNGTQVMVYGVILNHYAPFEGETSRWSASLQHHYAPFEDRNVSRGSLEDATDDLIRHVLSGNSYLATPDNSARALQLDGSPAYATLLSGVSPVTGEEERVTIYTRGLPDGHVIYALCVVPARDYGSLDRVCSRMMDALRVNDDAVHASERNGTRTNLRRPR